MEYHARPFSKSSPASYRSHTSCTAAMTPPGVVGVVVAKGRCRFHHLLMQQRLAAVHCHQSRTVGNARMRPFELANLFAESFETLPRMLVLFDRSQYWIALHFSFLQGK